METRRMFKEFAIGERAMISCLMKGIIEKESNNGSYCVITLMDTEGFEIDGKKWNCTKEDILDKIPMSTVVDALVTCQEYKGNPSYVVEGLRKSKVSIDEFRELPPKDREEMFKAMYNAIPEDNFYGKLVRNILDNYKKPLMTNGAAKRNHHAFTGGLLFHMHEVFNICQVVGRNYEGIYEIDKNLLAAGAILHDIGKVYELKTDEMGVSEYTVHGRMLGHVIIGIEVINKAVQELIKDNPTEHQMEVLFLKHMIASHHGKGEWGAPVTPCIVEATILHEADMIDSRMNGIENALKGINEGEFTDTYNIAGGYLYKRIHVQEDKEKKEVETNNK